MALRLPLIATLAIAATASTAAAERAPARFEKVLTALAGFRLDTRDKGFTERPACRPREHHKTACALLEKSWSARTVKLGTSGRDVVVQELWLLRYQSAVQVEQARRSFTSEFNDPFSYHPFKTLSCGRYLVVVEGRYRFPTPLKQLRAAVKKALGKSCR